MHGNDETRLICPISLFSPNEILSDTHWSLFEASLTSYGPYHGLASPRLAIITTTLEPRILQPIALTIE